MNPKHGHKLKMTHYAPLCVKTADNCNKTATLRVVYKSRQPAKFAGFSARFRRLLSLLHESKHSLNMSRRWTPNRLLFTKLRLLKNLKKTLYPHVQSQCIQTSLFGIKATTHESIDWSCRCIYKYCCAEYRATPTKESHRHWMQASRWHKKHRKTHSLRGVEVAHYSKENDTSSNRR